MASLRNFINAITNDNRIYTAEDIGEMTNREFLDNEKAIDYQLENLGIPRRGDLAGNPDVVYVHSYTRDDGTEVRAHYRSKPDGVGSNNYEHSGTSTGAAAGIEQPTLLEGGITYNNYPLQSRVTIDDFIYKNVSALKSGEEVSGSLGFTSDSNLHSAFGKVDVLSAKLQGKYIEFILLDTYDFNPNEKNWKVQMGYSAQKAGLLNPYFTIVKVKYKI